MPLTASLAAAVVLKPGQPEQPKEEKPKGRKRGRSVECGAVGMESEGGL